MNTTAYTEDLLKIRGTLELLHAISVPEYLYEEQKNRFSLYENADECEEIDRQLQDTAVQVWQQLLSDTVSLLTSCTYLSDMDQKILALCQSTLEKTPPVPVTPSADGLCGLAILSIGKLINLCSFLYERYSYSAADKEAMEFIENLGLELLPSYDSSIIHDLFELSEIYQTPDRIMLLQLLNSLATARATAAQYQPAVPNYNLADGSVLLRLAESAYTGFTEEEPFFVPLQQSELPNCLSTCTSYRETSGLLNLKGSLKAVFAKAENKIYIGFAGTEVLNKIPTLGADIQQLVSPSLMYLRAVGIVRAFLNHYPDRDILVAGHSLGGGLAQMAVLANSATLASRVYGAAFNSAGLSSESLTMAGSLGRLQNASVKITHFRSPQDPVSELGALAGGVILLDGSTFPYHCISNIKDCFP